MKSVLYIRADIGTKDLIAGGSVTHTLGVIDGFIQHGYHVYCASSAMHALLQAKKKITYMPLFVPQWCRIIGHKITSIISHIWFLYTITVCMYRVHIDFVYQRYSMLNILGVIIAWIKKKPLILEFNGSEVWVDKHWSPHKKIRLTWIVAWVERINITHATRIVVVSEQLKEQLIMHGVQSAKIVVQSNGVDIDQFDPMRYIQERDQLRTLYGMQDCYVFGFIGSFSYWHGITIISALMPRLLQKRPQVHFFLIGDGPLLETLKKEVIEQGIQQRVTFVGTVPYAASAGYLSACDAYLCPSQPNSDGTPFFGSPTKLFEYMSMGKPIIASNVGQLKEIVTPDIGFLVSHDDVDGFVHKAMQLIDVDDTIRNSFCVQARAKAVQKHSWKQHVYMIEQSLP